MDNLKSVASNVTVATAMSYSPLTMSQQWPKSIRLLLVILFTTLGTISNGFFFTSFFIERTLRRKGFVFLALAGFSDFIITSVVMPAVSVVLISGHGDTIFFCQILQFIVESAEYSYNLFYMLLAIESYYRHFRSLRDYMWFVSMRIRFVCTSVYTMSITSAAVGVFFGLDYDYCERKTFGNYDYRLLTSILFFAIPFIFTLFSLWAAFNGILSRKSTNPTYKRSKQSDIDFYTCCVNIGNYMLYILFWVPYIVVIYLRHETDHTFYQFAWIGLIRSVFASSLYAIFVENFHRAYGNIYNYCFCKKSLPASCRRRRGGVVTYDTSAGNVRVVMEPDPGSASPMYLNNVSAEEIAI